MSCLISEAVTVENWQAGFLKIMPAIRTHFKIKFRHLSSEQRAEKTQEAIASACASYRSLVGKGRVADAHPATLAGFAVNHVHNHRHLGGTQDAARDAMSVVAQKRHQFQTISYDRHNQKTGEWEQIAIEDRKTSIPDLVSFRVDFGNWLNSLTNRDRRIISSFIRGDSTGTVARQLGISEGRVSQLRRKYEILWRAFQRQAIVLAA